MLQQKTVIVLTILLYCPATAPIIGCYVTSGYNNTLSWINSLPPTKLAKNIEEISVVRYYLQTRDSYMLLP